MYQIQNAQQITRIYNEYMVFDFPKDELKPLAHILSMVEDGTCTFYALKEDGRVLSYFSVCQNGNGLLVDYLAVNPELRGQGIGSRMLDFLKSIAEDKFIIIECEDVNKAESIKEQETRKRRIAFYERAGFKLAGLNANLFGVEYTILTYPTNITPQKVKELYSSVYLRMLGQSMFNKFLKI